MAKVPFFKVLLKDTEEVITEKYGFHSMVYEQCHEKDNVLMLSLQSQNISVLEEAWVKKGAELLFFWGVKEGEDVIYTSGKHLVRVKETKNHRGLNNGNISFTLEAYDLGHFLKDHVSVKKWTNKTASEMVQEIADFHLLKTDIKRTSLRYESLHQSGRTDWEFIQYLLKREDDYRFSVQGDILSFVPNNYRQESNFTITLGDTENGLESYTFEYAKKEDNATASGVKINSISETGGAGETKSNKNDSGTNVRLNDYPVAYDADGKLIAKKPQEIQNRTGKVIFTAEKDPNTQKVMANNAYRQAERNALTLKMSLEGSKYVNAVSGVVFTFANARFLTGNYLITEVRHSISSGGYMVEITAKTNAVRKPISKTETEAVEGAKNKTTGKNSAASQNKKNIKYDENAKNK